MSGWQRVPLGEVCAKITDGTHHSPETFLDRTSDRFLYLTSRNVRDSGLDLSAISYVSEKDHKAIYSRCDVQTGDVLLTKDGAGTGNCCINTLAEPFSLLSSVCVLRPRSGMLDPRFLLYFLQSADGRDQVIGQMTGAAIKRIILRTIKQATIPLPPLEEQRRIVAVLDEAFSAIATATANAEKNLSNGQDLIISAARQIFDKPPDDWIFSSLGDLCELYQPQTISRKEMVEHGPYPVFGANGIIGRHDRYNHEEPQLLVTCRGATCGSVNVSEPFSWITGNAMVVKPHDNRIRIGLLRTIFLYAFDFSKVITGAAQPQITRQSFAPASIAFPKDSVEQASIEAKLQALDEEVNRLDEHYRGQLANLAALKQSLLHRAFTGELTATKSDLVPA